MSDNDIRSAVLRALGAIAPEADLEHLDPDVELREQLDVDSMDFLNFIIGLHKQTGIAVPEKDYPRLLTLRGCLDYLKAHACSAAT